MNWLDYPKCGARGKLSDADVIKLQNLAMTDGILSWHDQDLECQMPEGHGIERHLQLVTTQSFGAVDHVWWASWLDMDGLRDEAALFVGPTCDATESTPDGGELTCLLLAGHTTPDDERHVSA